MKLKKLSGMMLTAAFIAVLLSACGGGGQASETTAAADQKTGSAKTSQQETQAQAEITADPTDFYGVWEYADSFNWVAFYGDSTYEWYNEEGLSEIGDYYIEGVELHLVDSGLFYCLDGEGGLIDSDGDALFLSELPDYITAEAEDSFAGEGLGGDVSEDAYYGSDPGDGGYDPYSDPGDYGMTYYPSEADYYGTWESRRVDKWLVIYTDGTWTQYYEDGSYDIGTYYIDEGELCFNNTLTERYHTVANGDIESQDGEEMFRSEVPQYILEGYSGPMAATEYYGSDPGDGGYNPYSDPGDGGYDPYSDPGDYGINNDYGYLSMDDYVGTWERYDSGVWYTIHGDGTYKKTYFDGDFVHGNCWMNGYQLVMDGGNTLDFYQGNVVDENGDPYYSSVEPSF